MQAASHCRRKCGFFRPVYFPDACLLSRNKIVRTGFGAFDGERNSRVSPVHSRNRKRHSYLHSQMLAVRSSISISLDSAKLSQPRTPSPAASTEEWTFDSAGNQTQLNIEKLERSRVATMINHMGSRVLPCREDCQPIAVSRSVVKSCAWRRS